MTDGRNSGKRYLLTLIGLSAAGGLINILPLLCERFFGVRVFIGDLGTVLVTLLGGALPGIVSAIIPAAIMGVFDSTYIYFVLIGTLVALLTSFLKSKGYFDRITRLAMPILAFALVDAACSTVLKSTLTGGSSYGWIYEKIASLGIWSGEISLLISELIESLVNCLFVVLISFAVFRLLPDRFKAGVSLRLFRREDGKKRRRFRSSLLAKVVTVVLAAEIALGSAAYFIGFYLYREVAIKKYSDICRSVTEVAALSVDPERADDYVASGGEADFYKDAERMLYGVKDSFPQVMYLYAYRIEPGVGCRVVFDLDVEGTEGSEVGSIVGFDESFTDLLPRLYAGEEIEPIITDDTYGWLLTVYRPVYDHTGKCVFYMCADVSMSDIVVEETSFLVRLVSLFVSLSILIMALVFELFKQKIIYPLNDMADAADGFAYDTSEDRQRSLERLKSLRITTNDEIRELHSAECRMAEDSTEYIDMIKRQSALISKLQEDIIIDFAEMVEARDKCTGDHVKKTAHYVEAIARELQREGKFPETINDEYVARLVRSAPLHDIGKIKISDLILNKPGRLTDDEFALMKTHTVEGRDILSNSSAMADSEGYLADAVDMANYHHERWDGTGYPCGAKGDEIPLSARIMAVADVFDALVSERSYKKPFSVEEAMKIIREESGTHFDPVVTEAFLRIAESAYGEYKTDSAPEEKKDDLNSNG